MGKKGFLNNPCGTKEKRKKTPAKLLGKFIHQRA
jgi:hypothetical protein